MAQDMANKRVETNRLRQMVHLSGRLRWTSAITGFFMAGFAGFAVYRGTDGAATTAFVAAAALFILLAIAGVIPSRIKSGEHEIEMVEDAVQHTANAAALEMNTPQLEAYAESLSGSDQSVEDRLARHTVLDHLQFERRVVVYIENSCSRIGATFSHSTPDFPGDGLIIQDETLIPVFVKMTLGAAGALRVARRFSELHVLFLVREFRLSDFEGLTKVDLFKEEKLFTVAEADSDLIEWLIAKILGHNVNWPETNAKWATFLNTTKL